MAETGKAERSYLGLKETVLYGVANGGQVFGITMVTTYVTYFLVNIFHIDTRYVSVMLFIEGMWDTFNDPLMGSIVDRTRTRYGKLRPYLLGVPIPHALMTILFFAGPLLIPSTSDKSPAKIIYMIVTYFFWEFFYTIGDVPFWGMSAAVSPNPADRTKAISSARLISSVIGSIPTIIIPILLDSTMASGGEANLKVTFFVLGTVTSVFGMGLFSLSGLFVKERVVYSTEEPSFRDCLNHIIKNPPLRLIILKEVIMAFSGVGGVFATFYYIDVLHFASASIVTMVPVAVVGIFAFMLIPFAKKHFNNRQLVITSSLFTALVNLLVYFAGLKSYTNTAVMIPLLMLNSGLPAIFSAIGAVIPTEMIGETVDYMEWKTGLRNEGVSFAVLTFIGKFAGAVSRSLGTALLPVIGYKTSHTSAIIPQSPATMRNIWFMFMAAPVLFRVLGTIPMFFYDLVGEKRERMLSDLAVRRAKLTQEVSH